MAQVKLSNLKFANKYNIYDDNNKIADITNCIINWGGLGICVHLMYYLSLEPAKSCGLTFTSSTFPVDLSFQQKCINESSLWWMKTVPLRLSAWHILPCKYIFPALNSNKCFFPPCLWPEFPNNAAISKNLKENGRKYKILNSGKKEMFRCSTELLESLVS